MDWHTFDSTYVQRLVDGHPEVEEHFTRYFGELLQIKLRARVRTPELREDAVQETFLRVLSYLRRNRGLDHPERLGAFVNTVCNNVLMESFRSQGRWSELPEHMADPPDGSANQEARLVSQERKRLVRTILDALPGKDRAVLRAIYFEERNKDEVCREFSVDRDYLRVLLYRAKLRFKRGLAASEAASAAAAG